MYSVRSYQDIKGPDELEEERCYESILQGLIKEYEPADLQIKQYAERNEGLHIPATCYLEDLKKAFEAGQKDKEAQIEKMKNCKNCKKLKKEKDGLLICTVGSFYTNTFGKNCDKWEIKENE